MSQVHISDETLGNKPGKISMSTAWGEVDDIKDKRKMIMQSMKQLEWFARYGKGKSPAHTQREVEAFKELLLTDDSTIDKFNEIRPSMRENKETIVFMKNHGWWKLK